MSKFNYTQALLAGISGAAAATAISAVLSLSPLKNDDYVKAIGFAPATGGFGAAVGLLVYFCSVQINGVREEIQNESRHYSVQPTAHSRPISPSWLLGTTTTPLANPKPIPYPFPTPPPPPKRDYRQPAIPTPPIPHSRPKASPRQQQATAISPTGTYRPPIIEVQRWDQMAQKYIPQWVVRQRQPTPPTPKYRTILGVGLKLATMLGKGALGLMGAAFLLGVIIASSSGTSSTQNEPAQQYQAR